MNSYVISLVSGILVYIMMWIDSKLINPSDQPVSFRIPMFVMLLLWILCEFILYDFTNPPVFQQSLLNTGFYNK